MFVKRMRFIVCVIVFVGLFVSCNDKNVSQEKEKVIQTDIEFVQMKFPKIKEIEAAKYYYWVMEDDSRISVGLIPKEFSGVIHVGKKFADKISKKYKWKKCKQPVNDVIMQSGEYHFWYSEDFGYEYMDSLIGEFYYDKDKRVIYFDGGY